jgi:hypothetical protein
MSFERDYLLLRTTRADVTTQTRHGRVPGGMVGPMGLERGPGFLRSPPRGWIVARAFPVERAILADGPDAQGSQGAVIDTSHRLKVTWEVQVEGRKPVRFSEERRAPAWILSGTVSGKRWYRPRLRGSYGLWRSLGVPGFVDPADPTRLWVDWDAAFEEHTEAWDRKGRVEREIAAREGGLENVTHRLFNPLNGKLRPGEESLVEDEIARRAGRAAASGKSALDPVPAGDQAEQARRIAQSERLARVGRKGRAVVVAQAPTGRDVGGMPVLLITIDVEENGSTRRVTYEHIWGRRHAEAYGAGKRINVRIDPDDPEVLELG